MVVTQSIPQDPRIDAIKTDLSNIRDKVDQVTRSRDNARAYGSGRGRGRGRSRSFNRRDRSQSRPRSDEDPDICWYHKKYGDKTSRCTIPCKLSGTLKPEN